MSNITDFRQIQRRTNQLMNFEDGFWDLLLGSIFMMLAIYPVTREILGPVWNLVLFLSVLALLVAAELLLRRYVSGPRIGYAQPRRSPKLRLVLAFTILTTSAMRGLLRIQWHKLMVMFVSTVVISALTIIGIRLFVGYTENGANKRDQVLSEMQVDTDRVNVKILKSAQPNPLPLKPGQSCLDRIKQRRVIRVGFNPDRLPFSYVNSKGQLVGFDVELVYRMALDLGANVEFVPYTQKQLAYQLGKDHFDIAVSGVAGTLERSENMLLSEPYLSVDLAFVVKDYRSRDFKTLKRIRKLESISVGVYDSQHSVAKAAKYFPGIRIVELESERDFFEKEDLGLDALLTSAQGGSAWTLLFPDYTVVNPLDKKKSVPLVFPMRSGDTKMESYLEDWISLKELDGTIDELYDYWILGKKTRDKKPRWSVIRDVLHVVD